MLGSIYKVKKREILWRSKALQETAHAGVGSACGIALSIYYYILLKAEA